MKQPSDVERAALRALWQDGRGVLAQYFMNSRESARDAIEDAEDEKRGEAIGESKALKEILVYMSGADVARTIKLNKEI